MGRLIEVDEVKKRFPIMENDFGMVINERLHKGLDEIPTVEAIPKADYENRLKADMVAALKELQLEIEEIETGGDTWELAIKDDCNAVIQQKINEVEKINHE